MSYAALMVYVDVDGKPDGRVSVAADLARRFDAHLIGIASGAPISVVFGEDAPNEAAAETPRLRDIKALFEEKAQQFRAAAGSSSQRVEWRSVVGLQADVVTREARAADLVIIKQCSCEPGSISRSRSRQLYPQGWPAGSGRADRRNGTPAQANCRRLEGCARGPSSRPGCAAFLARG